MSSDISPFLGAAGRVPLLTASEEIHLATRVRRWQDWPGGPDAAPAAVQRSGRRARERMISANMRLVVNVAKRYARRCRPGDLEMADLLQEGCLGLARGVEKFDPARGYKFSTFAFHWIRQGVSRTCDSCGTVRTPINVSILPWQMARAQMQLAEELGRQATAAEVAEQLGTTPEALQHNLALARRARSISSLDAPTISGEDASALGDLLHDADAELPMQAAERDQRAAQVQNALTFLSDEQRQLIEEHLLGGMALRQVAKDMNISVDKAGALLRQGKRRLMLMLQELREEPALQQVEEPLLEALENLRLVAA